MKRTLSLLPWLAVVILAIVAYRYATRAHDLDARVVASDKETSAALAAKDSAHHSIDSLAIASVARQDSINRLSRSADSANNESAKLRSQIAALKRPAETDSTNPNWKRLNEKNEQLAASETQRADSVADAFRLLGQDRDAWKSKTYAALVVVDSLGAAAKVAQGIVHDQANASSDKCRILWTVPCPSRSIVMLFTVVGTLVVSNNAHEIARGLTGR